MTLTLDLSPEMMRRLENEAAQRGQTVAEYAREVLEQGLASGPASRSGEEALTDLFAGIPRRSAEDLVGLAREQGVKPVERFEDLLGDFWPEDESVDDFLEARQQWQREGTMGFPYDQPKKRAPRRADR